MKNKQFIGGVIMSRKIEIGDKVNIIPSNIVYEVVSIHRQGGTKWYCLLGNVVHYCTRSMIVKC